MSEEVTATPLLTPAGGTPAVIDNEASLKSALELLAKGSGPFAVDAERASGFRYSARAYLIQIKRTNGGLHLIEFFLPRLERHGLPLERSLALMTDNPRRLFEEAR